MLKGRGFLVIAALAACGSWSRAGRAQQVVFSDSFESSPTSWTLFEEVVGGNSCYGTGLGSVTQSTEQAHDGTGSLRVFANQANTVKSNHVLAQQHLSTSGVAGRYRYEVWAMVDPQAGDGVHEGQTGPELSLQNTRQVGQAFFTTTGGIQYIENKFSGQGVWNVWSDRGSGTPTWTGVKNQVLTPGVWYKLTLELDYDINRYIGLDVAGGSVSFHLDLSSFTIAQESKFSEEALWATLESENTFSGCTIPFEYRVYYDQVTLQRLPSPVPAMPMAPLIAAGFGALAIGMRRAKNESGGRARRSRWWIDSH
jgi:hypothetical protein